MSVGVAQRESPSSTLPGSAADALSRSFWRAWLRRIEQRAREEDPRAARARRVILLVLAMTAMNLADLTLSLTYMRSIGMYEANPLAREMIAIGGADQLVRYKLFLTILSGGLLYLLRRHRFAEQAAWASVGVLLLLTMHWGHYNNEVVRQPHVDAAILSVDSAWVYLGDE